MHDARADIVAIDGPAGAGKSSVSVEVARRLGMAYLDSGAMYRAATWWAMHRGVDLENPEDLTLSTREMPLEMRYDDGDLTVIVDGHDVSEAIRTPEVTRTIRCLDGIQGVRSSLVRHQQAIASQGPTVAEGRDMGTVVFPDARCKIYLDASIEERTQRRARQMAEKDIVVDMDELRKEIAARDENDRTRDVAPLRQADDAHLIDSSTLSFEEVVDAIVSYAQASQ